MIYWKSSMLTDSIYELIIHWHVRSRKKKKKKNMTQWVVVDELISSTAIRSSAKIRGIIISSYWGINSDEINRNKPLDWIIIGKFTYNNTHYILTILEISLYLPLLRKNFKIPQLQVFSKLLSLLKRFVNSHYNNELQSSVIHNMDENEYKYNKKYSNPETQKENKHPWSDADSQR